MPDSPFDKRLVRRSFNAAADHYDAAAVLQREVGERLLERLDVVRLQPQTILDLGAGTGWCTAALQQRYRKARLIALDLAPQMLVHARRRLPFLARRLGGHGFVCGDAERLPLADASCDLIVSNLTLQWCSDLDATFAELRRVLRPGGLLHFTTLGPDTLHELRQAWQAADPGVHVNAFIDMHDVGDAMVRAALADPVMDMERITMTYAEVRGLLRDLKDLGAHNVNRERQHSLTGRNRLGTMIRGYEQFRRPDGLLPATYEVVYGHAWAPEHTPQQQRRDGATRISLAQLRGNLRGNTS